MEKQQSNVCASEEVTVLIKIFAILFLLVLTMSAVSMSMDQHLWSWSFTSQEHLPLQEPTYRPQLNLTHNMSDAELFRHALAVNRLLRNHRRLRRIPRIAFMFLSRGSLPLSPLWEKYFQGHAGLYSIYIHSHPSYHADHLPSSMFYQRQIPSKVIKWGSLSMVDAERRLLANALLDPSNERFVLVSESCIPLFNFSFTYRYLMASRHSFVDAFDDPGPGARGRYNPKLAPEVSVAQWRKGAQWLEVSRRLAAIVVNETVYYAKFDQLRHEMVLQDEHYVPTILNIKAPNLIANRTLTWALWNGEAHPKTFGKDDINGTFLEKINRGQKCTYNDQPSSVCYLFARKIAPSALETLLKLAPTSLGFG